MNIYTLAGWIGVLIVLVGYVLITAKRIAGDSLAYQLITLVANVLLAANSAYFLNWPLVAICGVFVVIAMITTINILIVNYQANGLLLKNYAKREAAKTRKG